MSTFGYIATRGLVPTGFSVGGVDLSASSVDDSFNSVTTVLSGLLNDEWILVAGFLTNAVNNGWFQVDTDSTATKIKQVMDTPVNLVTEAAGDSVTIVGYYRGLNESYTLETAAHTVTPSDSPVISATPALDGTTETIYKRNDKQWRILTDFISEADWPQWREFMQSVHGGEAFTFDAFGTIASPDDPVSVQLVGTPQYSNPYSKVMQISMLVKVL